MDSNLDLELIAALIDGRLSGEDRARALRLLADSDEALELFAGTLRVQRDTPDARVLPITTTRRWRQWKVLVPVAAAAALATVVLPRLVGVGTPVLLANEYAMELSRDPHFAAGLREGWEQREWAVKRRGALTRAAPGTRRAGSVADSKLAFRLGVRSVDLQIALQRGDTVLAGRLTIEIQEILNAVEFSELIGAGYTELRSRLATEPLARSIDRASAVERDLRDLLGSPSFAFGQWVGAAELAARTHDGSFFESGHGTRYIRSASPAGSLDPDDIEALQSIDARLSQGVSDRALNEVRDVLQTTILRRGG